MKKIGIVGCGTIGSFLAKRITKDLKSQARITGLCDIDTKKAKLLAGRVSPKPPVLSLERLIATSDLIIETASGKACPVICRKAIMKGKDVLVLSVGGLLGHEKLFSLAKRKGCRIILPSGAICGLDGLRSALSGRVRNVTLTTRKPPKGLAGAPYILRKRIDLGRIKRPTTIFDGSALQAVKAFPKNVNVSAALSIAGIGPRRTRVKIITSPKFKSNTHEVEVVGEFGRLVTRTENVPFPENPKTSCLAAYSALATLRQVLT